MTKLKGQKLQEYKGYWHSVQNSVDNERASLHSPLWVTGFCLQHDSNLFKFWSGVAKLWPSKGSKKNISTLFYSMKVKDATWYKTNLNIIAESFKDCKYDHPKGLRKNSSNLFIQWRYKDTTSPKN